MKLLARHKGNASTYLLPNGKKVLQVAGPNNHLSFSEDNNIYLPTHLKHNETENIGSGFVRHHNGPTRIDVNLNAGTVKYYPVRGETNKFIEIRDPIPPTAFKVNQIDDSCVEYYIDYPTWRLSFIINDLGIKTLITVNENYTGNGTFELGFRLVGLSMAGRAIKDGDNIITVMPYPVMWDESGAINNFRQVGEVYAANKVTITADLEGLQGKKYIDPSLGPIEVSIDAMMWNGSPNTNYGNFNANNWLFSSGGSIERSLYRFDVSAIPAGSTIDSASLKNYVSQNTTATGEGADLHLLDIDRASVWEEYTCSWNSYFTGNPWTTPGGDYIALQFLRATIPAGQDLFAIFTGLEGGVQTALDSYSGVFSFLMKLADEGIASIWATRNREYTIALQRPQLSVEYSETVIPVASPGLFRRVR